MRTGGISSMDTDTDKILNISVIANIPHFILAS